MEIIQIDEKGTLFLSPAIDNWECVEERHITFVIDLEGDLDLGISTIPNHMLYVYFPIYDDDLPDLNRLHAVARLAAGLVEGGNKVLAHCGMGFNRSALMAGLILMYRGMQGADAVALLREKRPGALFNEKFASYLLSLSLPLVT